MANRKPRRPKIPPPQPMRAGNLDHTDTIWGGLRKPDATEPAVNAEELLALHGYEFETPTEQLLLRLIDAHNPSEEQRGERLRHAVAAISGGRLKKRPSVQERQILLAVAQEYHREYFETRHEPELEPIIRGILNRSEWQGFRAGSKKSIISDLARKFRTSQDVLLVRATSGPEWDPLDRSNELQRISHDLAKLGVQIDVGAVRPLAMEI